MPKSYLSIFAALIGLIISEASALAQQPPQRGGPQQAHLVVTVEPKHGKEVPPVQQNEVIVYEGHDRDQVLDWVPAQGDHAALQLFFLLDDSSTMNLGAQLDDIRKFMNAQAPTTQIGVAYMQNGIARIVQDLTADHAAAAKSLRLPMGIGGANASPYFSLSDLIKKWPAFNGRREVFMVTDGIDRYYGSGDLQDPYVDAAVDDADKAGIQVSAVYNPDVGHFGHSYWQTYWGQTYLSQIADRTGGEAYYIGMNGPPVAFTPYLDEFGTRLQHQYLLTFVPKPQKKAGWQTIRLGTEVKGIDLVSAGRVWVTPFE